MNDRRLVPTRRIPGRRIPAVVTAVVTVVTLAAGCGDDDTTAPSSTTVPAAVSTTVLEADPTTTPPAEAPSSTVPAPDAAVAAMVPEVATLALAGSIDDPPISWDVAYPAIEGAVADDVVNAALAADAETGLEVWRREAESWGSVDGMASDYLVSYEVTFLDERYVSVLVSGSAYLSGAASPLGLASSATFDHTTGRRLGIDDLFDPAVDWRPAVIAEIRAGLSAQFGDLVEIDSLDLTEGTDLSVFNLTADGVRFTFAEGVIGPGALGTPSVEVRRERLAGVVSPAGPLGGAAGG